MNLSSSSGHPANIRVGLVDSALEKFLVVHIAMSGQIGKGILGSGLG